MKKISTILLIAFTVLSLAACSALPDEAAPSISTVIEKSILQSSGDMENAFVTVRTFSSQRGFSSEVHVLHSEKGNILFDPGFYADELKDYVESIGGIDVILISHAHWDNVHALDEAVAANPGVQVFMPESEEAFLTDPHLNCSDINGFSLIVETKPGHFTHLNSEISTVVIYE